MLNLITFFKRMARTASRSEVEEEDEEEEEDRRLRPPVVVVVVEEEEHLRTSLTEEEAVMVVVVAKRKRCLNGCDVVRLHILNASIAFSSSSSSSKGLCVYGFIHYDSAFWTS
jgi:hypothetical protein